MTKDWVEKKLHAIPVVGDADDPVVAVGLGVLLIATFVALHFSTDLFPGEVVKDSRSHVFQLAGGVLVVVGAYTAVRTVANGRAQAASQLMLTTLALLDSESEASRIAAIRHLPTLAKRRGADDQAIAKALKVLSKGSAGEPDAVAAQAAIEAMPKPESARAR